MPHAPLLSDTIEAAITRLQDEHMSWLEERRRMLAQKRARRRAACFSYPDCPVCGGILSDLLLDKGLYWCHGCVAAHTVQFIRDAPHTHGDPVITK